MGTEPGSQMYSTSSATPSPFVSRARETEFDPGWVRYNGELRYRWLDRFLSGQLALSRHNLSTGARNTTVAWGHVQEFSSRTRFTAAAK